MTDLLERAFAEAARRPEAEQDALARRILAALASEARWDALFADSQDALGRLARETLAEHRAGRTEPLDPDAL
jgi:TRAP-type C4-dicarboxylate transport system substrate-binding protein